MASRLVEAAHQVVSGEVSHPVTTKYDWVKQVIGAKADWWEHEVHTIAAEDIHKDPNAILALAWAEYQEAISAPKAEKLVELGDVMVFLAADIALSVAKNRIPNGIILLEEMYLAKFVTDELNDMGGVEALAPQMTQQVFDKLKNNFHKQLNPPVPEGASRQQIGHLYNATYQASRSMRKYAKNLLGKKYNGNTGMPSEWRTVYASNGQTPEDLFDVHKLALDQMNTLRGVYRTTFGDSALEIIDGYWEVTAPGMVDTLRQI